MAYQPSERSPKERSSAPAETRTTTQARQGVTGHKVRYMLYWGPGRTDRDLRGDLFLLSKVSRRRWRRIPIVFPLPREDEA